MPVRIYAHLSWTCWARLPLIDQPVADFLAPFLLAEVKRHDARVIEIGIVPNHVHLLLELPAAFDVPRLVQGLKGASARLANREGRLSAHGSIQPVSILGLRMMSKPSFIRALKGRLGHCARPEGRDEPFRARAFVARAPFAALRAGFQRTDKDLANPLKTP